MKKYVSKCIMIILMFIMAISFCNRSFAATLAELRTEANKYCKEKTGESDWLKNLENSIIEESRRDDAIYALQYENKPVTEKNIADKRTELMKNFIEEDELGPRIDLDATVADGEEGKAFKEYIQKFYKELENNFQEVRKIIEEIESEYGEKRLDKMNAYMAKSKEIGEQVSSKLGDNDPKRLLRQEVLSLADEEQVYVAQGDGGKDENGNDIKLSQDQIDKATGDYASESADVSGSTPIYHSPERTSSDRQQTGGDILEEIIGNSEKFTQSGDNNAIDNGRFKYIMSYIYNMFFQVGIVAAVVIAAVLGIKFMLSSLEQKAEVKKMLGVYVIACVVIFGSFGIWKLVLTILDQM